MKPIIVIRLGDLFDNSADLIVLPCSTGGTVTNFVAESLRRYGLPRPESSYAIGKVDIRPLENKDSVAKYIAFAASVAAESSDEDAIHSIGLQLGELTRAYPIKSLSVPLLGAGAGGLKSELSIRSLWNGFKLSGHPESILTISVLHENVYERLKSAFLSDPDFKFENEVNNKIKASGPSTHIATDRWTTEDTLGYDKYAFAIYSFMIHGQTSSPLAISIQAPWGGGKTSLMKMIQMYLNPQDKMQIDGGVITIKDLKKEIDDYSNAGRPNDLPSQKRIITIWFNPWEYQSTNEVWAGLADAIILQVADTLSPKQKELFWLRLNMSRIDLDKIHHQIYGKIINEAWQKAIPWIIGFTILFLGSLLSGLKSWTIPFSEISTDILGKYGMVLSTIGIAISFFANYLKSLFAFDNKAAAIVIGDYLKIPNYRSELGFIHHVREDLNIVFKSIPEEYKPKVVVFIDDLDRCSPQKVAEVAEGINLFLANEFPVMFIMGMDTEIVAAALESAHSSIISRLPHYSTTPIGWRFMDKFVQLPFVIPPPDKIDILRYVRALLDDKGSDDERRKRDAKVKDVMERLSPERIPINLRSRVHITNFVHILTLSLYYFCLFPQ